MGGHRVEDGRAPSNLQRFLDCTTPSVETHILPKAANGRSTTTDAWHHHAADADAAEYFNLADLWDQYYEWSAYGPGATAANGRSPTTDAWHHHHAADADAAEYFNLADLWDQYYEWSAYGAGATVQLHGGDKVVQYYVPYLSGIQLYTNKVLTPSRGFAEDYGADFWSDDEDTEKMSRSWSSTSDDSFNCDVAAGNRRRPGHLYFEFFEVCSPYGRIPLMDKVYELSQGFPGLTSLRSVDLSPASWMSVAWYPIYHIPYQRNVKDLSACFLTYHTISSAFQDHVLETMTYGSAASGMQNDHLNKKANTVSLSPFGLAANKIQGTLWTNPRTGDHKRMVSLFSAADSWLKQLGVRHHDFNYFITHPM